MDVARTSMIHAAAPHFLWPFAVQYATHQINLQPRVSFPETTPTLRWTGKVGDASAFRVWGSRAFVRDTSADKLSSRAGPAASGVSQVDPAEPVEVAVDSGAESGGAEPVGAGTGGAESGGAEPVGAGTGGAECGGAASGHAEPGGAEPGRVEPKGTVSRGAKPARAASGGALGVPPRREPLSPQQLREWYSRRCRGAAGATGGTAGASGGVAGAGAAGGAAGAGGDAGASGGAAGAGATGWAAGAGGAAGASGGAAGAGAAGGAAGAGAAGGAACTGVAGAAGGAAGARAAGDGAGAGAAGGGASAGAAGGVAETGDPGAEGTGSVSAVSGGAVRPQPYYVPLLQQVLGSPPSPASLSSAWSFPYSGPTRGLTERREPESRPVSPEPRSASPVRPVRAGRVSRPRPPPVPGTHSMTLRPSTASQPVPLPSPPASSLPAGLDPVSDSLRAARPAITRFLATAITDPLFESTVACALVTELIDFAAACRLDYSASLVTESASVSVCPPSVGGECALGTDVLEDRQEEFECVAACVPHLVSMLLALEGDPDAPDFPTPRSYAKAIEGPYSSKWQAAMDAEMAS
ncbi:unnamed protein product [Closterium sp. NIES-54]